MESNTVILNLDKYNELKDFSLEIRRKKIIIESVNIDNNTLNYMTQNMYGGCIPKNKYEIYGENEAIKKLTDHNQELIKYIELLEKNNNRLTTVINDSVKKSSLINWSLLKFWTWKRKYKNS